MIKGFDAGVEAGGIRNSYEVNILICYVLKLFENNLKPLENTNNGLTYDELSNIILKDGFVNYFEFINSLSELESLSQIEKKEIEKKIFYVITDKGLLNLEILEAELPKTIKENVSAKVSLLRAQKKRLEKNKATILKVDDGYILKLEILDIGSNLLTTEIFLPDIISAQSMKKQFLNNPKLLYQAIISTLTGDKEILKEIIKLASDKIF